MLKNQSTPSRFFQAPKSGVVFKRGLIFRKHYAVFRGNASIYSNRTAGHGFKELFNISELEKNCHPRKLTI